MAVDGVNERGLIFGALNFPASAEYLAVSEEEQSRSIASFEVGAYLLTTCATVDDVRQTLERVPVQGDHPNLFKVDVARAAAGADGIVFMPLPSMDDIPELVPMAAPARSRDKWCSRLEPGADDESVE